MKQKEWAKHFNVKTLSFYDKLIRFIINNYRMGLLPKPELKFVKHYIYYKISFIRLLGFNLPSTDNGG